MAWADGDAPARRGDAQVRRPAHRAVDLSRAARWLASAEERQLYTSATDLIPTTGIVKETSDKITAGASSDLDKARRLYEWIIDNTHRDPKTARLRRRRHRVDAEKRKSERQVR